MVFWTKAHFSGGRVKFSKIFRGLLERKKGGSLADLALFWGRLGKKGWGQYVRVGLIPWRMLMDFQKVIYHKNIKKYNNIHFTTNITIYMGHRHFEVLWSFFVHIVKVCSVFQKTVVMLIFSITVVILVYV